ncbi:DUF1631 family protein [Pelomonas sp. SE-A7]|uniref:DUF1631 family protein n=1 Tax=Pelomonas sp. SE-A7 TaxID=3054953 RepID=UPI00259CFD07|nr:DUF1631 family protein [Pelomonas sp. SE-A7]MDM4767839.1 DUF1631 family protein [Pelomonas sp. SE-A7]
MAHAPTLQSLVDDTLAALPMLARSIQDETQDELERRPQHFALLEGWRRQRGRFASNLEAAVRPMLELAKRGQDPLRRASSMSLDALSLVDEHQALQDVAIAHLIATVEDQCRPELHQLGNFFVALRGGTTSVKDDNPLRPALFAQAMYDALVDTHLDSEGRYALLKVAAVPLGSILQRHYAGLCTQLQAAQLSQMVSSYGVGGGQQDPRLRRMAELAKAQSGQQPAQATLDGLARKVSEINSRPQKFPAKPETPPVPGGLNFSPAAAGGAGGDLLTRLYDQILADPRLLPPVKALMARLQIPVVRLARIDPSLLRRQEHPTWQLLNRVAAHAMGFDNPNDERLQQFLQFMESRLAMLVATPSPSAQLFQQVLTQVDEHIGAQARQRSERSATALAALEREQMRDEWTQVLREQIGDQLIDAPVSPAIRSFLKTSWVDVIVQAMVLNGRDAPEAHAHIDTVDELLSSFEPCRSPSEGARLRARLPTLVQRLEKGFEEIALPAQKAQALMHELSQMHQRVLQGQPAAMPASAIRNVETRELSPEDLLNQLLTERESQMPSRWAHDQVDRGHLPTVPTQLYDADDSPEARAALSAWMDKIEVGNWYHLFIQSQWLTAQIAWISESRQFFLFVGQDAEDRHSLTRGALEKLLSNGLITSLEEETLVQRAVDTLMQGLAT